MEATHKVPSVPDHSEDRRRQILRAAMTCFARRGFHLTTMNDISVEAQISVGLIYRYFENKDAVITFMASEHLDDLRRVLEQARRAPTLFEALELVSIRHCEEQPEHLHLSLVLDLFAEAARNEQVRVLVRNVTKFFVESVTDSQFLRSRYVATKTSRADDHINTWSNSIQPSLRRGATRLYGEYRTRRLVLEAWDKLEGVQVSDVMSQVSENEPVAVYQVPDARLGCDGQGRASPRTEGGSETGGL